jgi:hypothetical protein
MKQRLSLRKPLAHRDATHLIYGVARKSAEYFRAAEKVKIGGTVHPGLPRRAAFAGQQKEDRPIMLRYVLRVHVSRRHALSLYELERTG